jgi:hypothetical protein
MKNVTLLKCDVNVVTLLSIFFPQHLNVKRHEHFKSLILNYISIRQQTRDIDFDYTKTHM